jgi:hypothetical protein
MKGIPFASAAKAVQKLLKVLNLSLNNIRCRDRMVKIIQYGSQMILGYYGNVLRRESVDMLQQAKLLSSTSRKAFWLLKSLSHLHNIIEMIGNLKILNVTNILALIEQCFLFLRFWFENIIFMSRLKLTVDVENEFNPPARLCWVVHDSARLIATLLHLSEGIRRTYSRFLNTSSSTYPVSVGPGNDFFSTAFSENSTSLYDSLVVSTRHFKFLSTIIRAQCII